LLTPRSAFSEARTISFFVPTIPVFFPYLVSFSPMVWFFTCLPFTRPSRTTPSHPPLVVILPLLFWMVVSSTRRSKPPKSGPAAAWGSAISIFFNLQICFFDLARLPHLVCSIRSTLFPFALFLPLGCLSGLAGAFPPALTLCYFSTSLLHKSGRI